MSKAPSKEQRESCWNSRDVYWKCLDDTREDLEKCKSQRDGFEKECSKTWVKHFDRRREYLKFKAEMQRGGDSFKEYLEKNKEKKEENKS